jgi:hypothetical protein
MRGHGDELGVTFSVKFVAILGGAGRSENIVEESLDARIPRRIGLPPLCFPELVVLRESVLDDVLGVLVENSGFTGAAVAGVYAEGFADQLSFLLEYKANKANKAKEKRKMGRTSLTTGLNGVTIFLSNPSNVINAVCRQRFSGLT